MAQSNPGVNPNLVGLDPTKPLTPPQIVALAHGIANAQTVGPLQSLAASIAQTNRGTQASEKLVGGYYTQFGKSAQQGFKDTQQVGTDLQNTLGGINQDTQSQLQGIGQNAAGAISAYMPAGDQSLGSGPLQSLAANMARQQGYAAQYGKIAETSGANQSANYSGLAAQAKGIGAVAGTQALGELARAGRLAVQPLNTQVATEKALRGTLYANALGSIRQQEFTNLATQAALSNTATGIASTAANEKANRRFTARQNKLDRASRQAIEKTIQSGETQRASTTAKKAAHAVATGKKPGLTPYEQQHENANLGRAISFVQFAKKKGVPVAVILRDAAGALGAYYDPTLVQAAVEVVQGGGTITRQTAAALHQMGIRGSTWNGKPIKVRGPGIYVPPVTSPSPASQVPGVGAIPGV